MKVSKSRKIKGIYFDEISDKIEERFLAYLSFDGVYIRTYVKGDNLSFLIGYEGKFSRKIDIYDEEGFVSIQAQYTWHLSLLNHKVKDSLSSIYENVSLSLHKPFLSRSVKVVIRDDKDTVVTSFYVRKAILERVTVE